MIQYNQALRLVTDADQERFNQFETEMASEIKRLLNQTEHCHLSVSYALKLVPKRDAEIKVINNATFSLTGSLSLMGGIKRFLEKQQEVEARLQNATLIIDIQIRLKEPDREDASSRLTDAPQDSSSAKQSADEPVKTFIPIVPKYHFDQIILPDMVREEIMSAVKVLECKDLIYNQWGFGEIEPSPKSIINMYGAPGTGKTMCAHAIAKHLGKKLLALNYAEIESKYVGEAPKNLMAAFDAAKENDCVLFFDEADSFLGKRIQNVTQGAEQALNSLRSQMLILLEEFSGVVLFATNLVTNFDPAFESRILKHIKFELPNQEARAAIIRKHLPPHLPVEAPFTDEQLMEASAAIEGFSGREIKGAILDLLLLKADTQHPEDIVFTFNDLLTTFQKKQAEKAQLKAEEDRLLKEKITKKLREKAMETDAEKKAADQAAPSAETTSEEETNINNNQ